MDALRLYSYQITVEILRQNLQSLASWTTNKFYRMIGITPPLADPVLNGFQSKSISEHYSLGLIDADRCQRLVVKSVLVFSSPSPPYHQVVAFELQDYDGKFYSIYCDRWGDASGETGTPPDPPPLPSKGKSFPADDWSRLVEGPPNASDARTMTTHSPSSDLVFDSNNILNHRDYLRTLNLLHVLSIVKTVSKEYPVYNFTSTNCHRFALSSATLALIIASKFPKSKVSVAGSLPTLRTLSETYPVAKVVADMEISHPSIWAKTDQSLVARQERDKLFADANALQGAYEHSVRIMFTNQL
jgi:hypothetical protein